MAGPPSEGADVAEFSGGAQLGDQAWVEIRAAAKRTPHDDTEARAALSEILFVEYPAFSLNREHERMVAVDDHSKRMLECLDEFAALYRKVWVPRLSNRELAAVLTGPAVAVIKIEHPGQPDKFIDDEKVERDLWMLRTLWLRTFTSQRLARTVRRANEAHRNEQREALYHWLCDIWIDHFNGSPRLPISRPKKGPPYTPYGPLIAFIRAAFRQIPLEKVPSAEAVAHAIKRQRRVRKDFSQRAQRLVALLNRMGA